MAMATVICGGGIGNMIRSPKRALIIAPHPIKFPSCHPINWNCAGIENISRTDVLHLQLRATNTNSNSTTTTTTTTTTKWSEFATRLSGEWDGYGADFTRDGKPIELPESVVPEAYREWEVKVFDWQTQCPTLAQPHDLLLIYKLIKLLPTVGCEADAATRYSVHERNVNVGGAHTIFSAFAYQPTGCYVAVWPILDHSNSRYRLLELEHCLVDPRNHESRVRIIQAIRVENARLVLQNIGVYCEQWYGPFRNGDQLGGCTSRDTAFASTESLSCSLVNGVWHGPHAVANFQTSHSNNIQELVDDNVRKTVRDECNLILLPKQLWSSVKETEDGETCFEVGWLLDQGRAVTSKCIFLRNAEIKEIVVASETQLQHNNEQSSEI